jgi:hypothetical protein
MVDVNISSDWLVFPWFEASRVAVARRKPRLTEDPVIADLVTGR